jgi:peptidoglycan/xylan/chitin deacetylase (PgdA/CDA1 family)
MIWYQSIPRWFRNFFPQLIWKGPDNDQTIYLTFDDGPHPDITPWVLDQLDRFQFKATFFCVGDNARKFPETFRMLSARGHHTGNHTMHHLKGWNTETKTYLEDVESCHAYVDSKLFRPPYGRIKSSQAKVLRKKYRIIMWTLLACDFDKNLDREAAIEGLKKKTRNGDIVVFHDSVKAEENLKVLLPQYLQFLNDNGFTCAVL